VTTRRDILLRRRIHALETRAADPVQALVSELDRRIKTLVSDYRRALKAGKSRETLKSIGNDFRKWFLDTFRIEQRTTPRGGKKVKEAMKSFLWTASIGPSAMMKQAETYVSEIEREWAEHRRDAETFVKMFSAAGGKEVLRELSTPIATYLNLRGISTPTFRKYVKSLDGLFSSLRGWRRKALGKGLKVALAGPDKFRGSSGGRYVKNEDTLYVRATPKVMKRTAGTYGAPDYILIHELGHRYEEKVGLGQNFDTMQWYTTRYSRSDSFAGSEAFAELFALGHFGITKVRSNEFADAINRFEALMSGRKVAAAKSTHEVESTMKREHQVIYARAFRTLVRLAHRRAQLEVRAGLVDHADFEMKRAGLFDKDSDYGGMLGKAVLELVKLFAKQGHSGFSAMLTLDVFDKVAKFKTLTPITSDPDEWFDVRENIGGDEPLWQSKRNPAMFSNDGGKTWYDIDEPEKKMKAETVDMADPPRFVTLDELKEAGRRARERRGKMKPTKKTLIRRLKALEARAKKQPQGDPEDLKFWAAIVKKLKSVGGKPSSSKVTWNTIVALPGSEGSKGKSPPNADKVYKILKPLGFMIIDVFERPRKQGVFHAFTFGQKVRGPGDSSGGLYISYVNSPTRDSMRAFPDELMATEWAAKHSFRG
jgi:hypothetical protein